MTPHPRIQAVLLDHGGTLVTDWKGDPDDVFYRILRDEGISVERTRLKGSSEYFQLSWADKFAHLPRGERWTPAVRAACNRAVLDHFDVPGDHEALARIVAEKFEWTVHPALFPDVKPTLEALKTLGFSMGVVSQHLFTSTDLKAELDERGIGDYFRIVLTSESAGFDKPDPALYRQATKLLGVTPAHACHVGNSLVNDTLAAQQAGLFGVLVDRDGSQPTVPGLPVIRSLAELPALLG